MLNIAGILSHPKILPGIPVHYMGLLSRFEKNTSIEKKYDYCILLSGPEPQRTKLEEIILKDIHKLKGNILLVRGKPGSNDSLPVQNNMEVKNHLPGNEMQLALQQSDTIICRSGYTTVMEILSLQKRSIVIPTPGQTEQEFLAERLMNQHICYAISQHSFELLKAINEASVFPYNPIALPFFNSTVLKQLLL
jgi:uncharacterized protein (TIGR00661 family)